MRIKNIVKLAVAGALLAFGAQSSMADTLNYQLGTGSTVTANTSDPGLMINTFIDHSTLDAINFSLADHESYTFNFFKIWTDEVSVNWGEDTVAKPISAFLDFEVPDIGGTIGGDTYGATLGIIQWGRVTWDGPVVVTAGDRIFKITLNDATFNRGLFGLDEGMRDGAQITATVKQLSTVRVPEGSTTLSLLGLALLGLASCRRFLKR